MATKNRISVAPEKLAALESLVASYPDITLKGDTNPYTSCNGNMFTMLSSDGVLSFRLPEKERDAFVKKYKTPLRVAHGVVLKEYVVVPDSVFAKPAILRNYFEISYEYVRTLKPKPTKR